MTDRKIIHISSASVFAVLLFALVLPHGESGRIVAAILLLPAAVLIPVFIKKRRILSPNKDMVLLIMTVIALVYVMLYYLTGLHFGFYINPYRFSVFSFFRYILPISAVIVFGEIVRYVLMAQDSTRARVLCYWSCVLADLLLGSTLESITAFHHFIDFIAGYLFPALLFNLLYNYLTRRYGMIPNLVFRWITTLHAYIFGVIPGISDSLHNFFRLLLPIAIYLFLDALYEKKRRYALGNTSRFVRVFSGILTAIVLIIMMGTVMLTSNQFRYGSYVIATESMTGELNKGDVVLYEAYRDRTIEEGQVIVFEQGNSVIIHRVVDIEIINGITRYTTKGDANENVDSGYITDGDIVGLVDYKIPYLGYPTLWMRSLFKR